MAPTVSQVEDAGTLIWAVNSDVSVAMHKFKRTQ